MAEHERDLSCFTELAVSITDLNGHYLSCSARNADRLGRPVAGIIGHNWREWVPAGDLQASEGKFARAAKEPVAFGLVSAIRPDGRIARSRLTLTPTVLEGGVPAIFQLHSTIFVPKTLPQLASNGEPCFDARSYMRDLSKELVRLATQAGLVTLGISLESFAGAIAESAARTS